MYHTGNIARQGRLQASQVYSVPKKEGWIKKGVLIPPSYRETTCHTYHTGNTYHKPPEYTCQNHYFPGVEPWLSC